MTQQAYEQELEHYVETELDGGIHSFETTYIGSKNKVQNHMAYFLKKYYHGNLEKLKNVNIENSTKLNIWLEKNNLIPTNK